MKQTSLLRKLWLPLVLLAACIHLQAQDNGFINIGGAGIILDYDTDKLATEGWKWEISTKTLTLNSTYTKGYITIGNSKAFDIKLVYSGDVTISGDAEAALTCTKGTLTISREEGGAGTLTLSSTQSPCLLADGILLMINSGAVTVNGNIDGGLDVSGADTEVTVNGNISGGLTLYDGTVVVTGEIGNDVTKTGGTLSGGEKQAATVNELDNIMKRTLATTITLANSIELNGTLITMAADHTLTIPDGTTLTFNNEGRINTSGHKLSINGKGTANIENSSQAGISGGGTLTLDGIIVYLMNTGTSSLSDLDINVNDGAILTVDAPDISNVILIDEGKTLTVEAGGKLKIESYSYTGILNYGTLDLKSGSTLTIDDGEEDGSCAIENYGTLKGGTAVNATYSGNSCAIYLYKGSKVQGWLGEFMDRGVLFTTNSLVTVGADTEAASAAGLTEGLYIYSHSKTNFCKEAITITTQPQDAAVTVGEIIGSLTVAATATNEATVAYQWYEYLDVSNSRIIDGETNSTFTIPDDLAVGEHTYYCTLTAEGCETVWSDKATVTVSDASAGTIWIGNYSFDMAEDDKDDTYGWSWNEATSTLTLGANFNNINQGLPYNSNTIKIDCSNDPNAAITLAFTANVTISAMGQNNPLQLSGGSLTIKSEQGKTLTLAGTLGNGLYMQTGDLTLESGTVIASSEQENAIYIAEGNLTVGGTAQLEAASSSGDYAGLYMNRGGISITGGAKVTVGETGDDKKNVIGNLTVGGSTTTVQVYGAVDGNLIVTNGTVTVAGEVDGDTFVTGGTVTVEGVPVAVTPGTVVMNITQLVWALRSSTSSTIILGADIAAEDKIDMGTTHILIIPTGTTLTIDNGYIMINNHTLTLKGGGTVNIVRTGNTIPQISGGGNDATLNLKDITVNLKNNFYLGGLRGLNINVDAGGTIRLESSNLLSIDSNKTLTINQDGKVDIASFNDTGIGNMGTLLIDGGTLSIAEGEGANRGIDNHGILKNNGGILSMQPDAAIYMREGSTVEGFAGKFSDRGEVLTSASATVGDATEDPEANALTAGLYINNGGVLTKHVITYTLPQDKITVTQGSITGSLEVTGATTTNNKDVNYQWYESNTTDPYNYIITGATKSTFAIPTSLAAGEYTYYCLLSAEGCESFNLFFTVTVNPPASPGAYHTVALTVAPGITCNYAAGNLTLAEGENLHLTFRADDAALTAADILFTVDGVETAFNTASGSSSYLFNPVAANHTVVIALREYAVTLPEIEGLTATAANKAAYGKPFTFTLSSETLDLSGMIVYANGTELTANALRISSYSYTLEKVEGPITITVEGVNPTGNADIAGGKVSIAVESGELKVESDHPVDVAVYSISGKSVVLLRALSGSKSIALPSGIYVVRAGEVTTKVMVND